VTAPTTPAPAGPADPVTLDFWFDPLCPWAWLTSRWILQAAEVRALDLRFRVMSLAVLNGRETDDSSWWAARTCVAAGELHGDDVLLPLYTALGTRRHVEGRDWDRALVEEALSDVGLPTDLADAMTSEKYDERLRASHQTAMDLVGDGVGTPVLAFSGRAIFGPVVTPAPKGEDAGRLWDGVATIMSTPGFYELKRSRLQAPSFD